VGKTQSIFYLNMQNTTPKVKARYVIHPLHAICTRVHKATVYPPSCIPHVTVCNTLYGTSINGGQ